MIKTIRRRTTGKILASMMLAAVGLGAQAQDFPSKPITVIVAYGAGGGTDLLVRTMAVPLQAALGQQILVQNSPGAGGGVAAVKTARNKPDGYTLLATTSSTFTLEPQVQKTAYSNDQFDHIGTIAQFQGAIFARADKPYNNWAELVEHGKKNGGVIKYASFFQLDKLLIGYMAAKEGIKAIPVPTKGGSGAARAVLAGDVDAGYSGGSWAPQVESGAAKALFATTYDRLVTAPDLVSMKDLGFDFGTTSYLTLSAPKGVPAEVMEKLAAAVAKAVEASSVQEVGKKRNMEIRFWSGDQTRDMLATETRAFGEMIRIVKK